MNDKKDIDRLFQERFKEFYATPDPEIWQAIENQLKAKDKPKRIIPIWWKLSGAAAILILGVALLTLFNVTNKNSNSLPVVIEETPIIQLEQKPEHRVVQSLAEISSDSNPVRPAKKHNTPFAYSTFTNSKKTVINTSAKTETSNTNAETTPLTFQKQQEIANYTAPDKGSTQTPSLMQESARFSKTNIDSKSKTKATSDSLSIETAIAEANPMPATKTKTNKWEIQPNIAAVYYNSTGHGSHLDEQFVNNSKSGEINTSFGIGVGYALNDKLKIRTGVNSLKLSFNTNDVILYENPGVLSNATPNLRHVNTSSQSKNLTLISSKNLNAQQTNAFMQNETTAINQDINYFEIPLEIEFNLINKRLAVNLIGGFSTFILENNSLYSNSNKHKSYLGEATNINDVSFSSNLGVGLDYNFSKRFLLSLEPTVKYQLNAYNNTSGTFNPYIFGVYTGFSFKF